ncbi:MAG: methyltransferase domain-containing protein [Gammaproteobacteria bacterium]|nr:MAG: methyltransferase domain-containing protein [Gammaproteobacteria bacterium]
MTLKSRFYDYFVADRYDKELAEVTDDFRKICIERVGLKDGDTVLDLGCGTGLNQPHISAQIGPTGRILGIDASEKMLSYAKDRAAEHGYADNLQLIQGDLRNLAQLTDDPVDAVVATLIFSVVPAWRQVFAASFALLKPGGRYGVMDNYWPKPSLRLWFLSWTFAADAKRPGFEPLQDAAEDFVLEYHPPDSDVQFYVAHGSKPGL